MEENKLLKVGDLVRLKSGGPVMTINDDPREDECVCVWFNDKNEPIFRHFHPSTLIKIEKE